MDKCWIQMDRNIGIQKDRSDCRLKERYRKGSTGYAHDKYGYIVSFDFSLKDSKLFKWVETVPF